MSAVPDVPIKMLTALPCPDGMLAVRNRAMLLLGFGAALRRSELVGLLIRDVQPGPGCGLSILVAAPGPAHMARGQQIAIWAIPAEPLLCPAAALERWPMVRDDANDRGQ